MTWSIPLGESLHTEVLLGQQRELKDECPGPVLSLKHLIAGR